MAEQQLLTTQDADFAAEAWDGWSYHRPGTRAPGYAEGVSYLQDAGSLDELEARSSSDARAASINAEGDSLCRNGIAITIGCRAAEASADDWRRLKVLPPFPLDDAISGDQPPITGRYPRVEFPAEGRFRYAIRVHADRAESEQSGFGTKFEEHIISVHDGAREDSIKIPDNCPCDREIRRAISTFHGLGSIPQGDYKIRIEVERLPVVAIRIDGGRPLVSYLVREGPIKSELPVVDHFADIKAASSFLFGEKSTVRESPFRRRVGRGAKYVELGTAIPVTDSTDEAAVFSRVVLKTSEQTQETAELTYTSLRRDDSVREVAQNPNQGLLEVQVSRAAKIHSIQIDFTPRAIPSESPFDLSNFTLGDGLTKGGGGDTFGFRGLSPRSGPSVNIGRTELANPKVGPASPTMQAEWDGHVGTFRLCLTNECN